MSDGARKRQRLKLSAPSKNGTPHGSRSGSPDVPIIKLAQAAAGGSRAGSPGEFSSASPSTRASFLRVCHVSLFFRHSLFDLYTND